MDRGSPALSSGKLDYSQQLWINCPDHKCSNFLLGKSNMNHMMMNVKKALQSKLSSDPSFICDSFIPLNLKSPVSSSDIWFHFVSLLWRYWVDRYLEFASKKLMMAMMSMTFKLTWLPLYKMYVSFCKIGFAKERKLNLFLQVFLYQHLQPVKDKAFGHESDV